jgi:hypothetical protein
MVTFHDLESALHQQYYQILPLCGVVCTTLVRSRTIDADFGGFGLPLLGVEALIAMVNTLLMHYRCHMATRRFMQTSYSLLYVELSLSFQPLQESYHKYGHLVAHS